MLIIMGMYRVTAVSTGWTGSPGFHTFYYQDKTDPSINDSASALECATNVQVAIGTNAAMWPTPWNLQVSPTVDIINPANGDLTTSFTVATPSPNPGGGSGNFGPIPSGIVTHYLTDDIVNGHRVRGRSFWVPVDNQSDTDGTPTATMIGQANSLSTMLEETTHCNQVVWHRPTTSGGTDGSAHVVTGHQVRDTFCVLRSRRD